MVYHDEDDDNDDGDDNDGQPQTAAHTKSMVKLLPNTFQTFQMTKNKTITFQPFRPTYRYPQINSS
jgi:hypothetical protein